MCKMQFTLHERNILLRCMNLHHVKHSQGDRQKKVFAQTGNTIFCYLTFLHEKRKKKLIFFKLGILYRHILTCWELDVKYGRILFMALI